MSQNLEHNMLNHVQGFLLTWSMNTCITNQHGTTMVFSLMILLSKEGGAMIGFHVGHVVWGAGKTSPFGKTRQDFYREQ